MKQSPKVADIIYQQEKKISLMKTPAYNKVEGTTKYWSSLSILSLYVKGLLGHISAPFIHLVSIKQKQ